MAAIIDKLVVYCDRKDIAPFECPPRAEEPRAKFVVHPSSSAGCARAVAFSLLDAPKSPPPKYRKPGPARMQRIFGNGHAVHRRIQGYFYSALLHGVGSVTNFWEDVKIEIPELSAKGELDCIVEIAAQHRFLVEVKSMNRKMFDALKEKPKPRKEWIWQTYLYMYAAGLKAAIVVVECKDNQELLEFYLPWDEAQWLEIKEHVLEILATVQERELPEANTLHCHFCDYKQHCDAKGGTPDFVPWKNLTKIRFPN